MNIYFLRIVCNSMIVLQRIKSGDGNGINCLESSLPVPVMVICFEDFDYNQIALQATCMELKDISPVKHRKTHVCDSLTHRVNCVGASLLKSHYRSNEKLKVSLSSALFLLAFEITIDHPHTHVVKCTQLVRGENQLLTVNCASYCSVMGTSSLPSSQITSDYELSFVVPASKDLAQTSYFMATNRYVVFQGRVHMCKLRFSKVTFLLQIRLKMLKLKLIRLIKLLMVTW